MFIRGFRSALTLMAMTVSFAASSEDKAREVTFTRDVLPIFQENCQECHRPAGTNFGGMVAPMSLMDFKEARPWAKAIAREVSVRNMPPWDAAMEHAGEFANERSLSKADIETILAWVDQGARRGEPNDAPPKKEFANVGGWMIGEPDLIVEMPTAYEIGDDIDDRYTAFSIDLTEEMLPEDRWFSAFQCKPGAPIVHHFNLHLLTPVDGVLPPMPDRFESDEITPQGAGAYVGGTSSGTDANRYPDGYGYPLRKGSRVTFDIHYHKESGPGTAVVDSSSAIGFKFTDGPAERMLSSGAGALMNFTFKIPARHPNFKVGPVSQIFKRDAEILALHPHMHLRGKSALFEAFYPDGTSEVLLSVPNFDFSWQTVYYYKNLKTVPKGTRIDYTAWYDNSPEKGAVANFNADRDVSFGQPSTDEMMMGFVMSAAIPEEE